MNLNRNRRFGFTLSLTVLVMICSLSHADTLIVDPARADGAFAEVQAAIDAATDGDTVLIRPGVYVINESISFRGKAITVKGEADAEETVIRMGDISSDDFSEREDGGVGSVVTFENGDTESILEGVTLTGGWRGISCQDGSSATVRSCSCRGTVAPSRIQSSCDLQDWEAASRALAKTPEWS